MTLVQFLTWAIPAVSALIGAWAGARFALGRFRSERAFDRRLEWYEKTIERLSEYVDATIRVIEHITVTSRRSEDFQNQYFEAQNAFTNALRLVAVYASPALESKIELDRAELLDVTVKLAAGMVRGVPPSDLVPIYRAHLLPMRRMMQTLTDAARQHLGK